MTNIKAGGAGLALASSDKAYAHGVRDHLLAYYNPPEDATGRSNYDQGWYGGKLVYASQTPSQGKREALLAAHAQQDRLRRSKH